MNNQNLGKKQLGRALAVVMTVGSLLGVIASPAMAVDGEVGGDASWTLEVQVENTDYCLPNEAANTPASWSPDPSVSYTNGDNVVDYLDTIQTVGFSVDLGFEAGNDSMGCEDVGDVNPSGDVFASFSTLETYLVMDSLDCSDANTGCTALSVFNSQSSLITGVLNVDGSDIPGTRAGTLLVEWVPSESNSP